MSNDSHFSSRLQAAESAMEYNNHEVSTFRQSEGLVQLLLLIPFLGQLAGEVRQGKQVQVNTLT